VTPEREVTGFRDHWAETEAEWSHGGSWLTSFLVPPKNVSEALAAGVDQIDLPFLAPVPAELIHVSVHPVARSEGAPWRDLHDVVEAVTPALTELEPFDAVFRDPVVGYGGVYCDVLPEERFAAVRDAVRRGMARLGQMHSDESYWPHLALAYATGTGPIDSVDKSLFRPMTGLTWHVDTLTFVELRRAPGRYDWKILADVPIGRR
jgi:2'-5' RNA ligase